MRVLVVGFTYILKIFLVQDGHKESSHAVLAVGSHYKCCVV